MNSKNQPKWFPVIYEMLSPKQNVVGGSKDQQMLQNLKRYNHEKLSFITARIRSMTGR